MLLLHKFKLSVLLREKYVFVLPKTSILSLSLVSIILLLLLFYTCKNKPFNHGKITETYRFWLALILSCVSLSRMQWPLLQCLSLHLFFRRMLLLTVSCSLWHSAMEDSSHLPAISQDIRTLPADVVLTLQLSMLALVGCLQLKLSRDWKHSSNFYNALGCILM